MHEALALVQRIGGQELLDKVSMLFRSTTEERVERMRAAVASGDRFQIGRLSHAMKGSAAQVGAEPLRAYAASLEQEAELLDHAALDQRIEQLGAAAREAWTQIEQLRAEAGASS
jgi:HPt (histidine-containing phosphotransfer) domain-containing protein